METFSCRNCVQNPIQGLCSGRGHGYCLHWNSVLRQPESTTCKYHHRKDLPLFLVEDATKEHAAEFSVVPGIADLGTKRRIEIVRYSERRTWETREYDPQLNAVAGYHRKSDALNEEGPRKWRIIQAFAGSIDGRKALGFASLVRRYMNHCDSWWSSYRFILGVIAEIDYEVFFRSEDIKSEGDVSESEMREQATWEVFFARLSGIQEFGWHAAMESLKFPMRELSAYMDGPWSSVRTVLGSLKARWEDEVITLATREGRFFPQSREVR